MKLVFSYYDKGLLQFHIPLWRLLLLFSHSVMSDSLRPHEPQHARSPCPSPTPGVHPNLVFSNGSALRLRWPQYCSLSFSIGPSSVRGGRRAGVERAGRLWPCGGRVAAALFLTFRLPWVFLEPHGLCCHAWALSSVEAGAAVVAMHGLLSWWSAGSSLPGFGRCGARA